MPAGAECSWKHHALVQIWKAWTEEPLRAVQFGRIANMGIWGNYLALHIQALEKFGEGF